MENSRRNAGDDGKRKERQNQGMAFKVYLMAREVLFRVLLPRNQPAAARGERAVCNLGPGNRDQFCDMMGVIKPAKLNAARGRWLVLPQLASR